MRNRGQVTIFIVLAIVILAIIFLFLFVRSKVYFGPATTENLMREFPAISSHIEDCLSNALTESAYILGKQGGYIELKQETYRRIKGQSISYLCYNIPNQPSCLNRMLTKSNIQEELKKAIMPKLSSCLNIKSFEKSGYTLEFGAIPTPIINIGYDTLTARLDYLVKIKKGSAQASLSSFSSTVDLPLGRLYATAQDIIKAESLFGTFDTMIYSILKSKLTNQLYTIILEQPYPDKLYVLKISNIPTEEAPFIFQFLIQGE